MIATVLAALQLSCCGGAQPTGCCPSGVRPHPEIGGELLYTCFARPAVRGGLYLLASNPSGDSASVSIYALPAGGGEATRVTRGYDYKADLSPDGSWIAFLSARQGHTQLFAVRPDGSDLTQLTTEPGDKDLPRWRPG